MHIKRNRARYVEFIKLGFSGTVSLLCFFEKMLRKIKIIIIKIRTYLLLYIWSRMLFSSRDALLKLTKTTSTQIPFPSDCITLIIIQFVCMSILTIGSNNFIQKISILFFFSSKDYFFINFFTCFLVGFLTYFFTQFLLLN